MTTQRKVKAKKYQVILNDHLVGEILDHMRLHGRQRGVVTSGVRNANRALCNASDDSRTFGRVFKSFQPKATRRYVTLSELMQILRDARAIEDVQRLGKTTFEGPVFGAKTQAALRAFCEAACAEVDRGLFRC